MRGRRLPRRLVQLYLGLMLYGASEALVIVSVLGNIPWDVLHQGVSERIGLSIGTVSIVVGALVLLAWIPLRERPGVGTVSNVVVVGLALDVALHLLPGVEGMAARIAFLVAGVVLNGVATAAYVGARLGPGPRDGLMTGLVRHTGRSIRVVRTSMEVVVVTVGFALGGTLGVGTLLYALAIGPLVQLFLPRLTVPPPPAAPPPAPAPLG